MPPKSTAVLAPNLGLYLDRPKLALSDRMLENCENIRIKNGKIIRDNLGWAAFMSTGLTDPVTLIDQHFLSTGGTILIFGTTKNLYQYDSTNEVPLYINPIYSTGTVTATLSSTAITGVGTAWTSALTTAGALAGYEIHIGASSAVSVNATWYTLASNASSDTALTLTSAFQSSTVSAQPYTLRQVYNADQFDNWETDTFPNVAPTSGGTIGDQWYATNGVDNIQRWNGTDLTVTDLKLGFTCEDIIVYKEMLIAVNVTEAGTDKFGSMKHSEIGVPEEFTTTGAGEFVVHDGVDPILNTYILGDNLVFYSERNITLAQFVGFPVNFIFRSALNSIGPLSRRAVADFGDYHTFLGSDAMYRFDGVAIDKINEHVWREALRKHSPSREQFIQAHVNEEDGEVYWIIPQTTDTTDSSTGQPQKAYVEHYLEDVRDKTKAPYTFRDLPTTATGYFDRISTLKFSDITIGWDTQNNRWNDRFFEGSFPLNLFGDEDGNIFTLGEADSQAGTDITSFARFGLRPTVDGHTKGIIQRVFSFTEKQLGASTHLSVVVLTGNQGDDATTSASTLLHNLHHNNDSRYFVSPFVSARFYQIEYRIAGAGVPFSLSGYDVQIAKGGRR